MFSVGNYQCITTIPYSWFSQCFTWRSLHLSVSWCRIFILGGGKVSQILMKFFAFYRPRRFITMLERPRLFAIMSQMNPVHTLPSYVFKIHCIIARLFTPRPSKWSLFLQDCLTKPFMDLYSFPCRINLTLFYLILLMSFDEHKLFSFSLCGFLQPPVTYTLLGSKHSPHPPVSKYPQLQGFR
jgi:hypothetical protein